jgi:hypothetical protein
MTAFRITEHAIHRYLQRVLRMDPSQVGGVDREAVRAAIAGEVAVAANHPGVLAVRRGPWLYPIRDGAVVTVHRACLPNLRTGRQRHGRRGGRHWWPDDED